MREARIEAHGIPAKLYDPGDARGLLLFGHGGGRSKDSGRFVRLSRQYADGTGLAVVCIDAVDHGERRRQAVSPADPGVPRGWHSSVAGQMVADWRTVATTLSSIGPALSYVGFSMGAIFGSLTVTVMPTIKAAVFGVLGLPSGDWIDDPALSELLLDAASKLGGTEVLILNMSRDQFFSPGGALVLFDTIPGKRKRLMFWDGVHDDWPAEAISHSIAFINTHVA